MPISNENNEEIIIDVLDLGRYIIYEIKYLVLTGVVCTVLAFFVTMFLITPTYTSETKILVLNRQTEGMITSSDLQGSTSLTKDYVEMIQSRTVLEAVIAQLDLNIKYEELLSEISVSSQTDTRIVTIKVRDTDPYRAYEKANAIREAAITHILEGMNTVSISTVDAANIPENKSSPNIKKNILLVDIAGIFGVLVILIIRYVMNDKVKDSEDIVRYLGLSVLGSIPVNTNDVRGKNRKRKKLKRK